MQGIDDSYEVQKESPKSEEIARRIQISQPKVMQKPLRCALIVEILLNVLEVVMFVQPVEARVAAAKFK
jgi:hypothetical protein